MPKGFHFPIRQSLWLPLQDRPAGEPGQGAPLRVFGRLSGGATPDAAQTELAAVHGRMAAQFPEPYGRVAAEVVMLTTLLNDFPKGGMGAIEGVGGLSAVVMFQALALVLLTLACANVGLLIFARTATRSAELAMRTALGASRARIVGQIATEAFVLALLAAGVGLLIMHWLPNRLLAALWSPEQGGVPRWIDLGLTPATVVRALVLAGFSATVAAIFPALRVTGTAIRRNMQRAEGGGYGIRFGGVWNALVVADVAFALAAFGFVGGLGAKMAPVASGEAMVGFAAEEYLSVRLELPAVAAAAADPSQAAAARARVAETQRRLVERLEAEPGVRGVAMADRLPRMDHDGGPIEVEGEGSFSDDAARARVDPGFFEALGQPLLAGRGFHGGDLDGERSSVIVNSVFAERVLAGRNPIGRRVRFVSRADGEAGPWFEIVGMVGDLGMDLVQPQNASGVYHPVAPGEISSPYLAVRVADPAAFEPRLREIAAEVEPAAIVRAIPLDDVYPIGWYVLMGMAVAWTMFVVVLLTLAASGIYAIMAFAVAQRTREIGIRSALGARGSDIASTIGRRAAVQLGTGAVIGLPLAAFMYSRTGADPSMKPDALIVAVVPGFLVLLMVALVACTVPLLRALRITPTEAMKVG
jgi:predicted permease